MDISAAVMDGQSAESVFRSVWILFCYHGRIVDRIRFSIYLGVIFLRIYTMASFECFIVYCFVRCATYIIVSFSFLFFYLTISYFLVDYTNNIHFSYKFFINNINGWYIVPLKQSLDSHLRLQGNQEIS